MMGESKATTSEHVPNPLYMTGTVDTTGTTGGTGTRIQDISPIFDEHRRDAVGAVAEEVPVEVAEEEPAAEEKAPAKKTSSK